MDTTNPSWAQQPAKKKTPNYPSDSVLEALRDLGSGVGKTVTRDVVGKVATDALTSIFTNTHPTHGELRPNEPLNLAAEKQPQPVVPRQEIAHRPAAPMVEPQLKQQIEAVRAELRALAASVKSFHQEVDQALQQSGDQEGIYHLNFLNRLKIMLKSMREQIEDSHTWFSLSGTRKRQKGYWGMYKKHGTKFGLSHERTASTQAG